MRNCEEMILFWGDWGMFVLLREVIFDVGWCDFAGFPILRKGRNFLMTLSSWRVMRNFDDLNEGLVVVDQGLSSGKKWSRNRTQRVEARGIIFWSELELFDPSRRRCKWPKIDEKAFRLMEGFESTKELLKSLGAVWEAQKLGLAISERSKKHRKHFFEGGRDILTDKMPAACPFWAMSVVVLMGSTEVTCRGSMGSWKTDNWAQKRSKTISLIVLDCFKVFLHISLFIWREIEKFIFSAGHKGLCSGETPSWPLKLTEKSGFMMCWWILMSFHENHVVLSRFRLFLDGFWWKSWKKFKKSKGKIILIAM